MRCLLELEILLVGGIIGECLNQMLWGFLSENRCRRFGKLIRRELMLLMLLMLRLLLLRLLLLRLLLLRLLLLRLLAWLL